MVYPGQVLFYYSVVPNLHSFVSFNKVTAFLVHILILVHQRRHLHVAQIRVHRL